MTKLIAIDGNSLMHRAYYALPSMTARDGTPTGAVYGFVSMLLKLLDYEPDYMLVAFDKHGPTFRHEQYDEYKAGRRPTPDDLRTQFPMLKRLLREMGITVCECERYEADDILGTFSRRANAAGIDALLVTGDRDALQLINEHTHVLMTKKGISDTVEYDRAVLKEQYGLEPERMVDLKGLMGDSSDNLPGIPGVGEKTALKLLEKYGTLENVLANAENEKGALRQKLLDNHQSARMSYALGTINTDAPVSISLEDCAFAPASMAGAIPTMNTWELRSLIQRLPKSDAPMSQAEEIKISTIEVSDKVGLDAMMAAVSRAEAVAVTLGERLGVAVSAEEQYEISLGGATLFDVGLSVEEVLFALKPVLENQAVIKLLFDSKAMRHFLDGFSIRLNGNVFDAMIADYLLHAIHPADSLKTLCSERGMADGPAALIRLAPAMRAEMQTKGMLSLYDDVELPLTGVLFDMEREGIAVD
ncbi:MAG: DNA polymerase I, partial [Clostridia bacterium]|nr:DNA polymerase I [Clostridia bacterium]